MSPLYDTREAWLSAGAEAMRSAFDTIGHPLPVKLRITCGFPSKGGGAGKRRRIGECWPAAASADGTVEASVSPVLDAPREVWAVLVHELIHAADGNEHGHKGPFRKMMKALGLTGKPTATVPGEDFDARYAATIEALGPFPHARLTMPAKDAADKQTTRMIKCFCARCTYTIRTTRKWAKVGMPSCVCGAGPLTCADPLDVDGEERA